MNKKSGFTLAEVLITLAVIGVVAALTVPSLIANINSKKYKTAFKKAVSTLSQAALMAQSQYDVNFANLKGSGNITDRLSDGNLSMSGLLNNTLSGVAITDSKPSVSSSSSKKGKKNKQEYPTLLQGGHVRYAYMPDGTMIVYSDSLSKCTTEPNLTYVSGSNCLAYVDVNGASGPNKIIGTGSSRVSKKPTSNVQVPTSASYVEDNTSKMTDIYPVVLHDGIVEPASEYAKYILYSK